MYMDEWNYNEMEQTSQAKFADQNERIDNIKPEHIFKTESKKPGFLVIEHIKSQETQIEQKTYQAYLERSISESNDENKSNDEIKQKETDIMDYVQLSMYEMENAPVKDQSKLK